MIIVTTTKVGLTPASYLQCENNLLMSLEYDFNIESMETNSKTETILQL